jgi:hypothetical protein
VYGIGLDRLITGIVGSNSALGVDICFYVSVLSHVDRGLCDGLIAHPGVLPSV